MPASGPAGAAYGASAAATRGARSAYTRRAERTTVSTYPSRSSARNARCTGHGAASWVSARRRLTASSRSGGGTSQPSRRLGATDFEAVPRYADPGAVQAGQGGHRGDVVAELRVVVVLEHERSRAARGVEQPEPVGGRHHRARAGAGARA